MLRSVDVVTPKRLPGGLRQADTLKDIAGRPVAIRARTQERHPHRRIGALSTVKSLVAVGNRGTARGTYLYPGAQHRRCCRASCASSQRLRSMPPP